MSTLAEKCLVALKTTFATTSDIYSDSMKNRKHFFLRYTRRDGGNLKTEKRKNEKRRQRCGVQGDKSEEKEPLTNC